MCPLKHQCIEDVQLELLITGGYCDIIINVITIIILLLLLLIITIIANYYYYYHDKLLLLLLSLQIITIITNYYYYCHFITIITIIIITDMIIITIIIIFVYIYIYSNPQNKCQFQCVHGTSMVPVGCSTALILWYPVYPFERVALANPIKLPPKKREKHV